MVTKITVVTDLLGYPGSQAVWPSYVDRVPRGFLPPAPSSGERESREKEGQAGVVCFGSRAALSHSGSPGLVPEGNGTFLDDAHNVSEWREVLTGEEIPFEFEARGKLRHR